MHSISLIVVGMLACAATANPLNLSNSIMCPMVEPQCNCNGDTQCYIASTPCKHAYCVPTKPSRHCSKPRCDLKCRTGTKCVYIKRGEDKGCGTAMCARPENSNL
ncbi:hypothetical protein BDF22DRAFT_667400, partial [Syncephalis plumigaleata]